MIARSRMLRFDSIESFDAHRRSASGYVDTYAVRESDLLPAVLEALRKHPAVAWAQRVNKGFGRLQRKDGSLSPPFFWAFRAAVDITGQLRDGRRLEVEVKVPGKNPEDHQQAFLDAVNGAGGVGFVARDVRDVFRELASCASR